MSNTGFDEAFQSKVLTYRQTQFKSSVILMLSEITFTPSAFDGSVCETTPRLKTASVVLGPHRVMSETRCNAKALSLSKMYFHLCNWGIILQS